MNQVPHLPPKACSVKAHRIYERLPWFFLLSITVLLLSLTASFSVASWFIETVTPASLVTTDTGRDQDEDMIDPLIIKQSRQRMLTVYNKSSKVGSGFYSESAKLGTAAILSSDGWVVFSHQNGAALSAPGLEAIDYQGTVYDFVELKIDSVAGLVYGRLNGDGFRVMAIASDPDWQEIALHSVSTGEWESFVLSEPEQVVNGNVFDITDKRFYYTIPKEAVTAHNLVLSSDGQLLGMVNSFGHLLPAWHIEMQMARVLSGEEVEYVGLPFRGYLVEGSLSDAPGVPLTGYYVTYSPTDSSTSTVGRGDIVLQINGEALRPEKLDEQVYNSSEEIGLKVLREEEVFEISINKREINN